jgi:hypothetical protein
MRRSARLADQASRLVLEMPAKMAYDGALWRDLLQTETPDASSERPA